MSRYAIVTPHQSAQPHIRCFDLVKDALFFALKNAGHQVIVQNHPIDDATNIIIGYHLYDELPKSNGKIIAYQMEQIPRFYLLEQADEVWELSKYNVDLLHLRGIEAHYVPIGFQSSMVFSDAYISPFRPLFYGSMNSRRRNILEHIRFNEYGIRTIFNLYGKPLYDEIFLAGLVINCHYYKVGLTEQPRLSFLIANRVPFITEKSSDDPWPCVPRHTVKNGASLAEYAKAMSTAELMEMADQSFISFRDHVSYNEIIANVTS